MIDLKRSDQKGLTHQFQAHRKEKYPVFFFIKTML